MSNVYIRYIVRGDVKNIINKKTPLSHSYFSHIYFIFFSSWVRNTALLNDGYTMYVVSVYWVGIRCIKYDLLIMLWKVLGSDKINYYFTPQNFVDAAIHFTEFFLGNFLMKCEFTYSNFFFKTLLKLERLWWIFLFKYDL